MYGNQLSVAHTGTDSCVVLIGSDSCMNANRRFTTNNIRFDTHFATHSSEKAAMAFQVSKTRHNSRTKHYFANPRIKIQEITVH